jgi:hypothetical protein
MNKVLTNLFLVILLAGFNSTISGQEITHSPDSVAENVKLENFEQDLESVVFVPKGQWVAGVSVNYTQSNQNNYQFLIVEGISGDTYTFKVSPMVCYIFRNDMGVGAKFAYTRSLTKLENAKVVLDSSTDYSMENIYSLSQNYYAMVIVRNYFSLAGSRRFGFFNEMQLQLGGGQSKLTKGKGGDIIGSYERNYSAQIGLAPGMLVFLNNYSALEVNVGVLGFSFTDTKQINNQIYVSHRKSKSANFKINLFSISFGMAFYI